MCGPPTSKASRVPRLSPAFTGTTKNASGMLVQLRAVIILLIEDDAQVSANLARALFEAGHTVEAVADGDVGLAYAESRRHDLIILDVLLPGLDGFSVAHALRRRQVQTPILMLTARDAIVDRVRGLDAGADDYLTKPFATAELLARVRALGRRHGEDADGPLHVADLTLDPARHEVHRGDRRIDLTPKEFELLAYLMRNAGQVVSRDQILDTVWGQIPDGNSKNVELYIHYLRNKIDRETAHPLVRTIRGFGYMVDG
jgi:DNA-binding response OmpR family regulator